MKISEFRKLIREEIRNVINTKQIKETVDNRTLTAVEKIQDILTNLKSNTATNSNIPTKDKQGLLDSFSYMEEILENVAADIEQDLK